MTEDQLLRLSMGFCFLLFFLPGPIMIAVYQSRIVHSTEAMCEPVGLGNSTNLWPDNKPKGRWNAYSSMNETDRTICASVTTCRPQDIGDGVCDARCNNKPCGFDSMDCTDEIEDCTNEIYCYETDDSKMCAWYEVNVIPSKTTPHSFDEETLSNNMLVLIGNEAKNEAINSSFKCYFLQKDDCPKMSSHCCPSWSSKPLSVFLHPFNSAPGGIFEDTEDLLGMMGLIFTGLFSGTALLLVFVLCCIWCCVWYNSDSDESDSDANEGNLDDKDQVDLDHWDCEECGNENELDEEECETCACERPPVGDGVGSGAEYDSETDTDHEQTTVENPLKAIAMVSLGTKDLNDLEKKLSIKFKSELNDLDKKYYGVVPKRKLTNLHKKYGLRFPQSIG